MDFMGYTLLRLEQKRIRDLCGDRCVWAFLQIPTFESYFRQLILHSCVSVTRKRQNYNSARFMSQNSNFIMPGVFSANLANNEEKKNNHGPRDDARHNSVSFFSDRLGTKGTKWKYLNFFKTVFVKLYSKSQRCYQILCQIPINL